MGGSRLRASMVFDCRGGTPYLGAKGCSLRIPFHPVELHLVLFATCTWTAQKWSEKGEADHSIASEVPRQGCVSSQLQTLNTQWTVSHMAFNALRLLLFLAVCFRVLVHSCSAPCVSLYTFTSLISSCLATTVLVSLWIQGGVREHSRDVFRDSVRDSCVSLLHLGTCWLLRVRHQDSCLSLGVPHDRGDDALYWCLVAHEGPC